MLLVAGTTAADIVMQCIRAQRVIESDGDTIARPTPTTVLGCVTQDPSARQVAQHAVRERRRGAAGVHQQLQDGVFRHVHQPSRRPDARAVPQAPDDQLPLRVGGTFMSAVLLSGLPESFADDGVQPIPVQQALQEDLRAEDRAQKLVLEIIAALQLFQGRCPEPSVRALPAKRAAERASSSKPPALDTEAPGEV